MCVIVFLENIRWARFFFMREKAQFAVFFNNNYSELQLKKKLLINVRVL